LKKIDNFDLIAPFLNQEDSGEFHFLQILKRRKENSGLPKGEKLVETFQIKNSSDLFAKKSLITEIAELNNARVYINLNKCTFKRAALKTLEILAHKCSEEEYESVSRIYHHVCGKIHTGKGKKWVIDLDGEDIDKKEDLKEHILGLYKAGKIRKYDPFLLEVPTLNGIHLVTSPFNTEIPFESDIWLKNVLHKNPMTLLYYSGEKK
jgi:hypothetical protein